MSRIASLAAVLVAGLVLSAGATAKGNDNGFTVRVASVATDSPYDTVTVEVQRSNRRQNIWWLAQVVVRCEGFSTVGDTGWVTSLIVTDPLSPYFGQTVPTFLTALARPGVACSAWVYQPSGAGDYTRPDSNVVSFTG